MHGRPPPLSAALGLLLALVSFAGCIGGDGHDHPQVEGPEPKPSDLKDQVEHVVANEGYRVTTDPRGATVALADGSWVEVKVHDDAASDAGGAVDKAEFSLEAHMEPATRVRLRQMVTGAGSGDANATDYLGGVAHNVQVFGDTGRGPRVLPQVEAYLWLAGKARMDAEGVVSGSSHLVWVALTPGLRAPSGGAVAATIDRENLQLHVILPGRFLGASHAIAGAPEGFLYFVFERVDVRALPEEAAHDVGKDLLPPEAVNRPPAPSFQTLVDGKPADRGTRASGPLAVTFDASASSDPDAGDTIRSYSWRIFVKGAQGNLTKPTGSPEAVTGARVTYNFTVEGIKYVELVLRDSRGATANLTKPFYVSRSLTLYSDADDSLHAQTVSGGMECKPSVNCFPHQVTIEPHIAGATFTLANNGSAQLQGTHLALYAPGEGPGDPPATPGDKPVAETDAATLTVPGADLIAPGVYELWVWWEQGVDVDYTVAATLSFAPTAPS